MDHLGDAVSFHCLHEGRPEVFVYRLDQRLAELGTTYHVEFRAISGGHRLLVVSAPLLDEASLRRAIAECGGSAWLM
jgi:hypothetical protein